MTSARRLELDLPLLLDDLAMGPYPDYIDDVLDLTARKRQKPRWASLERWLPMDLALRAVPARPMPWRALALLVLALALALAAVAGLAGGPRPAPPFGRAVNGVIAFGAGGDLFLGDPITGTTRPILASEENDVEPVFSRDGLRIAFLRSDATDGHVVQLFAMDLDGSDLHEVTRPIRDIGWWDWTGDGRLIVTSTHDKGFRIVDPDGRRADVTLATDFVVDGPMLRPGGTEIVFRGIGERGMGIFVINLDGSGLRPIVRPRPSSNPDYELKEPRYSPDGRLIAYHEWDPSPGVMRQYVVAADGTGRRELGADPAMWLTAWAIWSNDSTRIAVQRVRDVPQAENGSMPYAIIDVSDGSIVETGPVLPEGGARVEWAPDDSVVLMVPNSEGVQTFLLDPAGGPWRVTAWESNSYPSWQRLAAPPR